MAVKMDGEQGKIGTTQPRDAGRQKCVISGSLNQSVVGIHILQEFLDYLIKNILVRLTKEIFLQCNSWITSSEVPECREKNLSYSPHQRNIPSMQDFLHYPFKKKLFTSQKIFSCIQKCIDYLIQIPRSPRTYDRTDCSEREI